MSPSPLKDVVADAVAEAVLEDEPVAEYVANRVGEWLVVDAGVDPDEFSPNAVAGASRQTAE